MKFSEYEEHDTQLYEELAQVVKSVIESAVADQDGLPRIQAVQARAKGLKSLRRKLEKRGLLGADDIDQRIKDLAGVRVILYSNTDVNRFLQRRIIPECLDVHWEETKAHYPSAENEGVKYEGFHYIVSLPGTIAGTSEHSKLAGLRCEVQIQTLLAHAFAESSHDIIYKGDDRPGFGTKAMEDMRARLNKTVDEYLRPAGFELDKVQADYERLVQGTELFERGELEALEHCADNNERYDRLKGIEDYLIPHYDDLGNVFGEIQRALIQATHAARETPYKEIEIDGHKFPGHEAKHISMLSVEILADLRYVSIEGTLESLIEIYKQERDRDVRKKIIDAVEKLASYNVHVWKQVGPYVQTTLADALHKRSPEQLDEIRSIAITIWRAILSSELDGTTWSADAVTISRGSIPATDEIAAIRESAIAGLLGLFDRSGTDDERRPIVFAFWKATQLPSQSHYSNALLAFALRDMKAIAEELLPRLRLMQFDLWEHIESHLFREYKRFKPLADAADDKMGCKELAAELVSAILGIRNRMNRNRMYVRYKTLVGFEGVLSQQWDREELGFQQVEALRKKRASGFVDSITDANADDWLALIRKCAATKSNDLATFPIFGQFLQLLAERKPELAQRLLGTGDANVLNFLPAILSGLAKSNAQGDYERIVQEFVTSGEHLASVAWHYRFADTVTIADIANVLISSIAQGDQIATIECLVFSIVRFPKLGTDAIDTIFIPALNFLTSKNDCRWVHGVWFLPELKDFVGSLSEDQCGSLLANMLAAKEIDHELEHILACVANIYPDLVWQFFGDRLLRGGKQDPDQYEAVPYQLFDLDKVLAREPGAAITAIRSWYRAGDHMFQFTGGRLLHSVFPACTPELATAAITLADAGDFDDIDFLLQVFVNYRGDPTLHPLAKKLVQTLPDDDKRLTNIEILLENTGVVSGEFGMVEAMRERKSLMVEWLKDGDARIQAFASRCIQHLDNRIATEQRDAEMRKEHRKRDYE